MQCFYLQLAMPEIRSYYLDIVHVKQQSHTSNGCDDVDLHKLDLCDMISSII